MNYTNKGNKATKTGFGEGVRDTAEHDERVIGLGADITTSVGMSLFVISKHLYFYSRLLILL